MLNMVVDDDYFLTLRPRLIEDNDYEKARSLVLINPAAVDHIVDSLVLRQGLYLFSVKPAFAIDPEENLTVVVEAIMRERLLGISLFKTILIVTLLVVTVILLGSFLK